MPSEKITFEGAFGDRLSAKLDWPDGELKSWVLFAHGFSIGKDLNPCAPYQRLWSMTDTV